MCLCVAMICSCFHQDVYAHVHIHNAYVHIHHAHMHAHTHNHTYMHHRHAHTLTHTHTHTRTHTHCSSLDLSFNHIGSIGSMAGLFCIKKLLLIQNKLTKIENLSSLRTLTMLELGSNRIRVYYSILRNWATCHPPSIPLPNQPLN